LRIENEGTRVALRKSLLFATAVVLSIFGSDAAAREKIDLVHIDYGAVLKGEIRSMSMGRLSLHTDEMDIVSVKWSHVTGAESIYKFDVETEDGTAYFGSLATTEEPGWLVVTSESANDTLAVGTVVLISPIKRSVWRRIDGYLNLGLSFTKSNEVFQFTFGWLASYRTPVDALTFSADLIFNRTEDVTTTQRQDYVLSYQRSLVKKTFGELVVAPQQNVAMGVQLRTVLATAFGINPIQSNHDVLSLAVGIDWNRERSTGPEPERETWEALARASYSFFRHDFPVTNISTSLTAFPSLTISERIRLEFDTTLTRELVNDLNTSLRIYGSHDEDPPARGAAKTDYGIIFSLGWSY